MRSRIRGCRMSDLERAESGGGAGGTAVLSPPAPAAGNDQRQMFWAVVGRAYWRSISTRIATGWVLLIIALTVLVPFIANQQPYTAVINGHREWPLFNDLSRVDLVWLVWGAAVVAAWFGFWRA